MVTAFVHLADGVFFRPSLHDDAIEREDHSGPVGPMLAMDEDRPVRAVREDSKGLKHEIVLGGPGSHRHVQKLESRLARLPGVAVPGAKVENGLDAQRRELFEAGRIGLGAPQQVGLYPVEIRHVGAGDRSGPIRGPRGLGIGGRGAGEPEKPGEGEGQENS